MITLRIWIVILCWVGFPRIINAQNVFYFSNDDILKNARLQAINQGKIEFTVEKEDGTHRNYSFSRSSLLMFFSKEGHFLTVSELSPELETAQKQIQTFLTTPPRQDRYDYLIKAEPLTVIPAKISYESGQVINYQTPDGNSASIRKNDLFFILHRDGRHELMRKPTEVAPFLPKIRLQLQEAHPAHKPEPQKSPLTEKKTVAPSPLTVSDAPVPSPLPAQNGQPSRSIRLTPEDYKRYREQALQKVNEFASYLAIITDQSLSYEQRDDAIEQAAGLFLPSATIQVNSINRSGIRHYNVKDYLLRLKLLPYHKVNITWSTVQYLRELTQESDGDYYGTITGEQTFKGYKTGSRTVAYSDITQKNVRVKLQSYKKQIEGRQTVDWTVLLGNIGIAR